MQIKKNGIKKNNERESVRVLLSVKAVFFSGFPKMAGWSFFFFNEEQKKKKNIAGVFREKEMKRKKKGDVKKRKKRKRA